MELITQSLYWLSTGLFIPLMITILFFLVRSFTMLGGFYNLFVNRKKFRKPFQEFIKKAETDAEIVFPEKVLTRTIMGIYFEEFKSKKESLIQLEKVVSDFQLNCLEDLGKAKSLTKMGPMLGLMGTLIPMGPALVGLAKGDIASLAENMQVAFATTVVGLFIGGMGFLLGQVKQRWYAKDVNDLHYIYELIKEKNHAQ